MKKWLPLVIACVFATTSAHAEDPNQHEREKPTTVTPVGGVVYGSWMTLPVVRGAIGFDVRHRWTNVVGGNFTVLGELGQTLEGGLGAHRLEIGGAVSVGGDRFQLAAGLHLSYAMLVRATGTDPVWHAIWGDIGGFGLGPQLALTGAVPVGSGSVSLVYGVRGSFDLFVSGVGWEVGPTLGVRF